MISSIEPPIRSRPARGGWIEIGLDRDIPPYPVSRPARGGWIEMLCIRVHAVLHGSRPARGGWIEIRYCRTLCFCRRGPAPQGAGGLKFCFLLRLVLGCCPAPQGAGGLKCTMATVYKAKVRPAPQGAGSLSFGRFFPAMYGTEYRRRHIMRFGPRQGSAAVRSLTSCCARRPRSSS